MLAEAREQGHAETPSAKKKQKLQSGAAVAVGGMSVSSAAELSGHSDAAAAVAWADNGCIYSGSMDHTVKPVSLPSFKLALRAPFMCGQASQFGHLIGSLPESKLVARW